MKRDAMVWCGRLLVVLMTVALLPAGAEPAAAEDNLPQRFQANMMAAGGPGGRPSSMLEFSVSSWTTEEDRQQVLTEIKEASSQQVRNRNRAVARALRGAPRIGTIALRGSTGWPLRFSREVPMEDGGRHVRLATDRPVTFIEAYANLTVGDFDVTLIELTFDKDGNGSGVLSLGTEVRWNDETEAIEITNFTSQPIRLGNVRQIK